MSIFGTYEVSYRGDNTGRKAIIDLIRWFGLSQSKVIFRAIRACKTLKELSGCDMAIAFGGVTGAPVRRLIAHIHGEAVLAAWSKSKRSDETLISSIDNSVALV